GTSSMRRSIRWTLVGSYGLLLAAVVGAFGATLYSRAADAAFGGVDASLGDRARAIAAAIEKDGADHWDVDLSQDYLDGLAAESYFAAWTPAPEGRLVLRGGKGPPRGEVPKVGLAAFDDAREIQITASSGAHVLVGRSIEAELASLAKLRALIVGAGAGVLLLGLFGGLWLARRTLAPVNALAAATASIGPRDLATRLDVTAAPDELRPLAQAFNATLERLEKAFERQTRFTSDASHELRTPLAVLRTQVEVALRADRSPDEYRATLEACLRSAQRMTALVEALLALARADADEAPIAREEVWLDALARETAELLQPAAEAENVTLHCAAAPARVHGDPRLLADVVSNLVHNGVRYNRPGGRVDVSVARDDGHVVLRVSDTGIGIPAEARGRLFERFYRVDPARSRERGGAGLGLAIAHRIVEAHGGSIDVESEPGEGSAFTVRLPSAD
ncbi:MAG TPA: heavy metal sensor histidine kinase, partial [Planctomycetota bacterium]|nr:heavy metal sensor histidine kinase [Planctomycetota bacterium]